MFHRIVSITGFVPIAPPLDFLSASTSRSISDRTLFASVDSTSPASSDSRTFELADIFSRFQDLEVARLGCACRYWSAWFDRQRSEMTASSTGDNAGASSVSPPKGDTGTRRPRIVSQRVQLERAVQGGAKGKGKKKCVDSAAGGELGDWEIGLEGEACEGWDWAGAAGIWR